MLQLNNLVLAVMIVAALLLWRRAGLRVPRATRLSPRALRRSLIVCGWTLIAGIVIKSIGEQFGRGRVQIAKSGKQYAYRTREPILFWGEIAGELLMVGGIGAVLVVLGRAPRPRD